MEKKFVEEMKEEFRELCGALSVEEIMSNKPLISLIEKMEKMFAGMTQ